MKGLTEKQQNIVEFIEDFTAAMEMMPTIYEIAEHFGIKTSTVFAHIRALQKKNVLHRSSKARSISLVKPHKKPKMPVGVQSIPLLESENLDPKGDFVFDERVFFRSFDKHEKGMFAFHLCKNDHIPEGFNAGDVLLVREVHPGELVYGDLLLTEKDGHSTICSCVDCKNGVCEMEEICKKNSGDPEKTPHIFARLSDPRVKGIVFGALSRLK